MGFITSPSPSNTREGREGGRQRGGKERAFFSASNVHTLKSLLFSMATEIRDELEINFLI